MILDKHSLSVIMAVHNEEKFLRQAIMSILDQSFKEFEFIIVDDASSDTSPEIIRSIADEDKRIIALKNPHRIGLTKSLNKALKLANGQLIARQDGDDISSLHRFKFQIETIKKDPNLAVIGTSYHVIDEQNRRIKTRSLPRIPNLLKRNQLAHGSVVMVKRVIQQLGGYNESFKYAQDYELWLRITRLTHFKIRNLTQPLYYLRMQRKSVGYSKAFEQRMYATYARKLLYQDANTLPPQSFGKPYVSLNIRDELNLAWKAFFESKIYILLCNTPMGISALKVYRRIKRNFNLQTNSLMDLY